MAKLILKSEYGKTSVKLHDDADINEFFWAALKLYEKLGYINRVDVITNPDIDGRAKFLSTGDLMAKHYRD